MIEVLIEKKDTAKIADICKRLKLNVRPDRPPLGYFSDAKSCVFILPKVYEYLNNAEAQEHALCFYSALRRCQQNHKSSKTFVELPLMASQNIVDESSSRLDAVLRIKRFNHEHADWIITVLNKSVQGKNIDWRQTIAHSRPLIANGNIVYTNLCTRKREIDASDPLIVIYYSILSWLRSQGHYYLNFDFNIDTIPPGVFEREYMNGNHGIRTLKEIRYKYFDTTSIELWNLCLEFFTTHHSWGTEINEEYLLATNFQAIFEYIIDDILSDQSIKSHSVAKFDDGRRLDHIWIGPDPIIPGHECFYIADSKYYDELRPNEEAICKQFVYPRNVVDNAMMSNNEFISYVYDPKSKGYYVLPNCLIKSAGHINTHISEFTPSPSFKYHHRHRLFDCNTHFLVGIAIDLKYIIGLYSTNRAWALRKNLYEKISELYRARIEKEFLIEISSSPKEAGCYITFNSKYYIARRR